MVVKVTVGNNVKRDVVYPEADTTISTILDGAELDYSKGTTTLNGATLAAGDTNKTLADFGFDGTPGKDHCYLLNVVKMDNAAQ